ncbi:MAG: tRNA glutamyl-Q(34) synthetase GluQRS [Rhodobacteraceae bacterium]|nr:tRNA glutamyl-Q(34) synthetase GluQRS [Paracoccaceae bacterium]
MASRRPSALIIERFAPSPTGLLHLGHGFSALTAFEAAHKAGGRFLLRIEDIDQPRCRPEFEQAIYDDLRWLGISWDGLVMRQSERMPAYRNALAKLVSLGLCYPCGCTRRDIASALSAPQEDVDPVMGPDGTIYPGTCRGRKMTARTGNDAVRLNIAMAVAYLGGVNKLNYLDIGTGKITLDKDMLIEGCGDIVLARKDIGTSYHLAVVVDDAEQKITHVTRGIDMASATPIHRLLQALLDLPTPIYRHHRLIRDANGKRLAKRFDAMALQAYQRAGKSVQDIRELLGFPAIPG